MGVIYIRVYFRLHVVLIAVHPEKPANQTNYLQINSIKEYR
jgi:hypothetical protein